jgi:hypothetical protein
MRGRPPKIITPQENLTKFNRTYEDEYATEVWTFDLNKSTNGPISVDIKYKTGAEKLIKHEIKEAKQQRKIALQMKKINNRNKLKK